MRKVGFTKRVTIDLRDEVYGDDRRVYDIPGGLKRSAAICEAINKLRDDHGTRMHRVIRIRTANL